MTIARPLRALIILATFLWCFFVYQLLKPSPEFHGPGDRYLNFERDPNLDRR
jgi:mannosyltransferase